MERKGNPDKRANAVANMLIEDVLVVNEYTITRQGRFVYCITGKGDKQTIRGKEFYGVLNRVLEAVGISKRFRRHVEQRGLWHLQCRVVERD